MVTRLLFGHSGMHDVKENTEWETSTYPTLNIVLKIDDSALWVAIPSGSLFRLEYKEIDSNS